MNAVISALGNWVSGYQVVLLQASSPSSRQCKQFALPGAIKNCRKSTSRLGKEMRSGLYWLPFLDAATCIASKKVHELLS
eukprot:scaffold133136_cov19-Tisochrysis_lutea.AAC.1